MNTIIASDRQAEPTFLLDKQQMSLSSCDVQNNIVHLDIFPAN